ncbi:MAG: hypothetical protein FWE04_06550 [Oscillospiraceae bacterium]|nr:hypothetical protein [Oscillospiraceae bacterium]
MPRTYSGRNRRTPAPRINTSPKKPRKLEFGEKVKKYFAKFLKQTGVAVAIILLVYIVRAVAPGFWANISPTIHSNLERDINFVAIYNGTVGRVFPDAAIDAEEEEEDYDDTELDYPIESDEYYPGGDDDIFIDGYEIFRDWEAYDVEEVFYSL